MLHPTRRKNEGKSLSRKHLELGERWRAFARERRRGKQVARKGTHMKHKAARARSRLDELAFGTFNVRTPTVNDVNVIDHTDTLLRPFTAKGCDVVGLQETKRDGTPEIGASGYCVYFSGDCTGAKGRKGQHEIGLAIKEEIVEKAGKDGTAIECISARLLKARISIKKSDFVTFVVAYAPT